MYYVNWMADRNAGGTAEDVYSVPESKTLRDFLRTERVKHMRSMCIIIKLKFHACMKILELDDYVHVLQGHVFDERAT